MKRTETKKCVKTHPRYQNEREKVKSRKENCRAGRKLRRRKYGSGRSLLIASFLICFLSMTTFFFQNADFTVLADDLGETVSSAVGMDTTPPTLNAAVNDGYLHVQAEDKDSGVEKLFICGYEYNTLLNGALSVRLQQFDAGYKDFSIYALDKAGNISQEYLVPNPYYEGADGSNAGAADVLPVSAEPTAAASATGTVTEHTKTKGTGGSDGASSKDSTAGSSSGNTQSQRNGSSASSDAAASAGNHSGNNPAADAKRSALAEADSCEQSVISGGISDSGAGSSGESGKEFYTIRTGNDKVFYLIIDRDKSSENVHFLTDISERDLLNATQDNSRTLPQNSAVTETSTRSLTESALPDNNSLWDQEERETDATKRDVSEDGVSEEQEEKNDPNGETKPEGVAGIFKNRLFTMVMICVGIVVIAVAIFLLKKPKAKEDIDYDDDEDADAYDYEDPDAYGEEDYGNAGDEDAADVYEIDGETVFDDVTDVYEDSESAATESDPKDAEDGEVEAKVNGDGQYEKPKRRRRRFERKH